MATLGNKTHVAAAAGIATVIIAVATGAALYVASYFTESLSQSIGNDLRVRLYQQLQRLSLAYYDTNRVGTILSTLTSDVQTIQSFASVSTLNIFTNTLTVVGMVVVMFMCRWDFTLIAIAVTPLLAMFVVRVNRAVRKAVKEVRTTSPICWPPCRRACSRFKWCRLSGARITRNSSSARPTCKP